MKELTKAEVIIWARKETWSIEEAALLISGANPETYKRLHDNCNRNDFRNEEDFYTKTELRNAMRKNAYDVKTVLESDVPDTQSPAKWIACATELGFEVDEVWSKLPDAKGEAVPDTKRSISKGEVINAFDGFHFSRDRWDKSLGDPPDWLKTCRVEKGKQGDNKASARWNPVLIAVGLLKIDKALTPKKLDAVFVRLPDWADEWQETIAYDR